MQSKMPRAWFRRSWFRTRDGRYFRNSGMVINEYYDAMRKGRLLKAHTLVRELTAFDGLYYVDRVKRWDRVFPAFDNTCLDRWQYPQQEEPK